MVYSILLLCRRKAGLTPAEFKEHFETKHVPLFKQITGQFFPDTHRRFYIQRGDDDNFPAQMLVGDDIEYDVVCIMTWSDESISQKYFETVRDPKSFKAIMDDDAAFVERSSTKVIVLADSRATTV